MEFLQIKTDNVLDKYKNATKKQWIQFFEDTFYHKPTDEQLLVYKQFIFGEIEDVEMVLDCCEHDESEYFVFKELL